MAKVGGLTTKFYRETKGMKVSGGQVVKAGTMLTREGDKWKPGLNVIGQMHLTAACEGEVYFTKKRGSYKRAVTYIHIRPLSEIKAKKTKKTVEKTAAK
jgi:ribosomal protein L27